MKGFVYDAGMAGLTDGTISWTADSIRILALGDTVPYVPDQTATTMTVAAASELTGVGGYTPGYAGSGRQVLAGKTRTKSDALRSIIYDAADPAGWTLGISPVKVNGYVIYKHGASDAASVPLLYMPTPAIATNGAAVQPTFNDELGVMALRLANPVTLYASFNGVDGTLPNAETGQAWQIINGGPCYILANQLAGKETIHVDGYAADCLIGATIRGALTALIEIDFRVESMAGDQCVYWLYDPATNTMTLSEYDYPVSDTTIGTTVFALAVGDRIEILLVGSSIKVYVNGVQRMTAVSTRFQSGTRLGFAFIGPGVPVAARWDDLLVVAQ